MLHYLHPPTPKKQKIKQAGLERDLTSDTYTLLSVMDMESSVVASLEISLSLALVAGAKM